MPRAFRILLALAVTTASLADAACNVIPSAERVVPTRLGSVSQPFAQPGQTVTVFRETPVFAADPAANRVAVRFVPARGLERRLTDVTVLPPAPDTSCRPEDCTGSRCTCVRFVFPDTDALVGAPDDGRTLTGPVEIRVQTDREITALVDRLSASLTEGVLVTDPVFPSFVALPPSTPFERLLDGAGDVLAAADAAGNLLVPLTYGEIGAADRPQTRFLEARLGAGIAETVAIESFTLSGQRLPPLVRRTTGETVIGTVDATESVLRIANGVSMLGITADGANTIVIPDVTGSADPADRADPLTLLTTETFAVFERRECDRPGECTDFNADGDTRDYFLMALDLSAPGTDGFVIDEVDGAVFPGFDPADPPFSMYTFTASERLATFTIAEAFGIDLNGDGDRDDLLRSGAYELVTRTRIADADGASRLEISDGLLAFSVPIAPGVDVLAVYDRDRLGPFPLLVADSENPFFIVPRTEVRGPNVTIPFDFSAGDGRRIAFLVPEALQGVDLTGDGDLGDTALLLFDAATGLVTNLRRAGAGAVDLASGLVGADIRRPDGTTFVELIAPDQPQIGFRMCDTPGLSGTLVPGASRRIAPCVLFEGGVADLNHDGDGSDFVLHVFTSASPVQPVAEFDLAMAVPSLFSVQARAEVLAIGASELLQGFDLNGDGRIESSLGPFGPFALLTFHAPTLRFEYLGVDVIQTFPPAARFVDGGFELLQATTDTEGVPGTRRVFLRDVDDDGRFEEIGVDQGGRIAPFDNCPVTPNRGQEDMDGDGIGDACDPLEPGRGTTPAEACLVEFALGTPGAGDTRTCRDGQPGCDADDVAGQCTFRVNVCLLVPDARHPRCAARRSPIARVDVEARARERGPKATDPATAASMIAALAGLGTASTNAGGVAFTPPLEPLGAARCTAQIPIVVPAGERSTRRTIRMRATTAVGGAGWTRVSLRCLPAE